MSTNLTANTSSQGFECSYNGKSVVAHKDANGWFTVDDGNRVNLKKALLEFKREDLTKWPQHFVDYYTERAKEAEENREMYKSLSEMYSAKVKMFNKKFNAILAKNKVKKVSELSGSNRTEALKFLTLENMARKSRNIADCNFFSECRKGIDAALDCGKWNNMLSLANHVIDSMI